MTAVASPVAFDQFSRLFGDRRTGRTDRTPEVPRDAVEEAYARFVLDAGYSRAIRNARFSLPHGVDPALDIDCVTVTRMTNGGPVASYRESYAFLADEYGVDLKQWAQVCDGQRVEVGDPDTGNSMVLSCEHTDLLGRQVLWTLARKRYSFPSVR